MQTLSHRLLLKVIGGNSYTFECPQPSAYNTGTGTGQNGTPPDYDGDNNTDTHYPDNSGSSGSDGSWRIEQ